MMEPLNHDQRINNASAHGNGTPFSSSPAMPDTDFTNLETFDFESFFAASQNDPLVPDDYATLQDIDFVAEAHTPLNRTSYVKPQPPESPGSPEPPACSELTGPPTAINSFPPLPYTTLGNSLISAPFPNVYMTSQQIGEVDWQHIQPRRLDDNCHNAEQGKNPMPALGASSSQKKLPTQHLSLPNLIYKAAPKSNRTLNITKFNPSHFYSPLAEPPRSWSPPQSIDTTFNYNAQGELDPACTFIREQISDYLTYHPLNTFYGSSPSTKHSGLKLWIQTTPADAVNRYPTKLSSKCRFATCPAPNRTIRNGQYRVAFDEQSIFGKALDPFHNAGYVHLFCLEKNFDFPHMCQHFNIQGDDREFPEGRNRMAITRDYPAMMEIVNNFIQNAVPSGGNRAANWYDQSLSLTLTKYHLENQCKQRQHVREVRNGNSLDRHFNNLDVMVEIGKEIRKRKAEEKAHRVPEKRKAGYVEDWDMDQDPKKTKFA